MPKRMCVPPTSATSPSTAERSNCLDVRTLAPEGAVIHCHHLAPKTAKTAPPSDSAVNQMGGGFYRLINVNVVRDLQSMRPFDNAV